MKNYFAYGSNLWQPRIECRVGLVTPRGVARLDEFALRWHKRSRDRSGKCDIVRFAGSTVFGVIYAISDEKLAILDEAEGVGSGYLRDSSLSVTLDDKSISAVTYRAEALHIDESLLPYDWYHALVVAGAQSHALPAEYLKKLSAQKYRKDSNAVRAAREFAQLELSPRGRSERE